MSDERSQTAFLSDFDAREGAGVGVRHGGSAHAAWFVLLAKVMRLVPFLPFVWSTTGFVADWICRHVRFPEFQVLNGIQAYWMCGSFFLYQLDERQYVRARRSGYFQTFDNFVE